jgi:hypothetical protein
MYLPYQEGIFSRQISQTPLLSYSINLALAMNEKGAHRCRLDDLVMRTRYRAFASFTACLCFVFCYNCISALSCTRLIFWQLYRDIEKDL